MDELKPCPFCGMSASVTVDRVGKIHKKKMYIYCHGCGLRFDWDSLPLSNDVSIEEYNYKKRSLIKRWNRRTNAKDNMESTDLKATMTLNWRFGMEHGSIVYTECLYADKHNGEEPPCMENCHIEGCEYHLVMYEDGYSRFGNEKLH